MSQTATRAQPVTREEYRRLPEGPPYYELIRGELVEMTRPSEPHIEIVTLLVELLGPHVRRSLKGCLSTEPNLYLPGIDEVYHPDLVYLGPDRLKFRRRDGIHGVPEVACEILSPTTWRRDRHVKLEDYCRAGIPFVWLIEPESPVAVEEYVLSSDGHYRLRGAFTAPAEWTPLAFPGWTLPLAELEAAVSRIEDPE